MTTAHLERTDSEGLGIDRPQRSDGDGLGEQQHRMNFYGLLASLLTEPPDGDTLRDVARLAELPRDDGDGELLVSMSMLGLAANTCDASSVADEFQQLFVGLGRGELVPYGSWYQTGFLMERPLSDLRDELSRLSYQRSGDACEPEDHVAALCEVMAMMVSEKREISEQSSFYMTHMWGWIGRFFEDLATTESAVFYRAVGRFGIAFCKVEKRYLNM